LTFSKRIHKNTLHHEAASSRGENMRFPAFRPRQLLLLFVLLSLFLFVGASTTYAAPQEAPTAVQTQGYYYTVQWGDTLSQVAVRSGTTMQAIMLANPQIVNPNLLYAGTVIFIPTGTPQPVPPIAPPSGGQQCRAYHTVLPGQYLLQIGNLYGVSPFAIAEANQIYNLNRIFYGQVLCIP